MFKLVKGFYMEDLIILAEQLSEKLPPIAAHLALKNLIENCKVYKNYPEFVRYVIENAISE